MQCHSAVMCVTNVTVLVVVLMTTTRLMVSASYNSAVVMDSQPPAHCEYQLATVGRHTAHLFIAARDRLLILVDQHAAAAAADDDDDDDDGKLMVVRSVSLKPRCRRDKTHRQLVTPCSRHNDASLLTLLPAINYTDTGHSHFHIRPLEILNPPRHSRPVRTMR